MDAIQGYVSSSDDDDANETEESSGTTLRKHSGYSHDFFGLKSGQQSSPKTIPDSQTIVKHVVASNKEQVSVEIPNSSFWNDLRTVDIQEVQDNIKTGPERSFSNLHTGKRTKRLQGTEFNKKMRKSLENYSEVQVNKVMHSTGPSLQNRKLFFIHSKVQPLLNSKNRFCKLPSCSEWNNPGHAGATNRLKWNIPSYSHLLASCSMDTTIKLWNIWTQLDSCVQVLKVHTKAVRDVDWSPDGRRILSSSYDRSSCIIDAEIGTAVSRFEHISFVTSCKYNPGNPHICLTGSHNQIQAWDLRSPEKPCKTFSYKDKLGQVQDLVLTEDGSTIFSCSDLLSRDSADRNLMAWDYNTGVVLSNQMYQDIFNVVRLKIHPSESQLLAQTTGNYIAVFSLQRPYKMQKHKRYDNHKSQEYNIGFDMSPNGQIVYSGSDDGKVYCYNHMSGKLIRTLDTSLTVAMDIASHPVLPSTIGISSWDGTLQVWR